MAHSCMPSPPQLLGSIIKHACMRAVCKQGMPCDEGPKQTAARWSHPRAPQVPSQSCKGQAQAVSTIQSGSGSRAGPPQLAEGAHAVIRAALGSTSLTTLTRPLPPLSRRLSVYSEDRISATDRTSSVRAQGFCRAHAGWRDWRCPAHSCCADRAAWACDCESARHIWP